MKLQLVIGNKNYSSWSMRPWIALRQAGVPFEEVQLKFDTRGDGVRVVGIEPYSQAGKVPVLMVDGNPVWDSLAICETAAELFPGKHLWPEAAEARSLARSACAEMHSGFQDLRGSMPMNIRKSYPGKGMSSTVQKNIDRIVALWAECRKRFGAGGPLLFGRFSIADAFFTPVVMRFRTYAVALPRDAQAYCEAVHALDAVREWCDAARRETDFVPADEPYAAK